MRDLLQLPIFMISLTISIINNHDSNRRKLHHSHSNNKGTTTDDEKNEKLYMFNMIRFILLKLLLMRVATNRPCMPNCIPYDRH